MFAGRRIFFVGIGGAGLSAYAVLSKAWGAEVQGWDRQETPYLTHVREAGIPVTIGPEPDPPEAWEVVVSSAYPTVEGRSRADFLAELVSLRRSVVVSGTHGKTTTTGMIAYCLHRLGHDPAFLIGGEVPQLGGNAGVGTGWLVVEGDESDRTVERLRPEIGVVTNVDLDHHTTFGSRAELEAMLERWLASLPHAVRGWELQPAEIELALPGEHNRWNAACALGALELCGVAREQAAEALRDFAGAGRRLERVGEAGGVTVFDSYAHHPAEVAADLRALRERTDGRLLAVFQPHLYSRTRHLARELAAALAEADIVCVTEIYAAREQPLDGVTGKLVVDALCELKPGAVTAWVPDPETAACFLARRARPADTVVTLGAGDVDRAARTALEQLR